MRQCRKAGAGHGWKALGLHWQAVPFRSRVTVAGVGLLLLLFIKSLWIRFEMELKNMFLETELKVSCYKVAKTLAELCSILYLVEGSFFFFFLRNLLLLERRFTERV